MIKRTYITLTILSFLIIFGCNSSPKHSNEDASISSDSTGMSNDSTNEWGAPTPPPEVEGDGSSLFSERNNKVDIDASSLENPANSSNNYDVISNWINNQSSSHSNRSESTSPSAVSPQSSNRTSSNGINNYTMEYDWQNDNFTNTLSTTSDYMLPYAAKEEDKMDFIRDFYAMLIDDNSNKNESDYLSMSCKNYIKENNPYNHLKFETFFGFNPSNKGKNASEILNSLTITPLGYDWFGISWDKKSSNKDVELKVIEFNRKLVVDMIR